MVFDFRLVFNLWPTNTLAGSLPTAGCTAGSAFHIQFPETSPLCVLPVVLLLTVVTFLTVPIWVVLPDVMSRYPREHTPLGVAHVDVGETFSGLVVVFNPLP